MLKYRKIGSGYLRVFYLVTVLFLLLTGFYGLKIFLDNPRGLYGLPHHSQFNSSQGSPQTKHLPHKSTEAVILANGPRIVRTTYATFFIDEGDLPSTSEETDPDNIMECYTTIKDGLDSIHKNLRKNQSPPERKNRHRWDPRFAPKSFIRELTESGKSPIVTNSLEHYSTIDKANVPYFALFTTEHNEARIVQKVDNSGSSPTSKKFNQTLEKVLSGEALTIFNSVAFPTGQGRSKDFTELIGEFLSTYGTNYTRGKLGLLPIANDDPSTRQSVSAMAAKTFLGPAGGANQLVVTHLFLSPTDEAHEDTKFDHKGDSHRLPKLVFLHPSRLYDQYFGNGPVLTNAKRLGGPLFDFVAVAPDSGLQSMGLRIRQRETGSDRRLDLVAAWLDPQADLMLMKQLWCLTKPGGLLLLNVPFLPSVSGGDGGSADNGGGGYVNWGSHRVYGTDRMYRLMELWKIKDTITIKSSSLVGVSVLWVLEKG